MRDPPFFFQVPHFYHRVMRSSWFSSFSLWCWLPHLFPLFLFLCSIVPISLDLYTLSKVVKVQLFVCVFLPPCVLPSGVCHLLDV